VLAAAVAFDLTNAESPEFLAGSSPPRRPIRTPWRAPVRSWWRPPRPGTTGWRMRMAGARRGWRSATP